jgi:RNA polymerase sigma factor (sigma-70 family)
VNEQTDSELLRSYAERRSEAAFTELVRRHVDLVYSAARRMVCDSHLAEDVTQTVFIALAKSAAQLIDRTVLSGWLHRTAQNIAAQTVRTDVRRRAREQEAAMNELLAKESDAPWAQIAPHLDAALDDLSEPDRDALFLRYFEGKSAREMAQTLSTSEEAAQKRVNRAVERLRESFVRRGVTVGAGGLVFVISANAVQAAPAGLVATISTAAFLAGTTISTTTATITKAIAMTTFQKAFITVTIAAGVVTPLVIQHQAQVKLRHQNEVLRQQNEQLAGLPVENDRLSNLLAQARISQKPATNDLSELLRLRGEVGSLRLQTNDLQRLQSENQLLKSALAKAATNNANDTVAPKESWAFQGYADPEAAFQSAFWAMNQGDAKTLVASLAPGGRESQKVQAWSEQEYLKKRQQQFDKVTAFKILDKEVVSGDEAILTIFLEGTKEADRFRLQRVGNDWKLDGPYRTNAAPIH